MNKLYPVNRSMVVAYPCKLAQKKWLNRNHCSFLCRTDASSEVLTELARINGLGFGITGVEVSDNSVKSFQIEVVTRTQKHRTQMLTLLKRFESEL